MSAGDASGVSTEKSGLEVSAGRSVVAGITCCSRSMTVDAVVLSLERTARPREVSMKMIAVAPRTCFDCGARNLEHFYTCKRDGRTLCAACFQQ